MTDIVERLRGRAREIKDNVSAVLLDGAADEIERLRAFAHWVIQDSWDGVDICGGDVQDKAEELGLLVKVAYDPEEHGYSDIAEPGDDWYVWKEQP